MPENKNELLGKVSGALIGGDQKACANAVKEALNAGLNAQEILMDGLKVGMDVIGDDYANKVIFLPNVLCAAQAMYGAIDILKPHLQADGGVKGKGKVVIGTVEGDMHDIGKNIVRIMLDGMAFDVIDLGRDVPRQKWIDTVKESKPDVVGSSTLMSTTLRSMEELLVGLTDNGLRAEVKTIIGGAATNATFAERIGMDAWGKDATDGVKKIAEFCAERRQ